MQERKETGLYTRTPERRTPNAAWLPAGMLLLLLLLRPASAETLQVRLENAGPAEVSRELERVLGTPVEVRGGADRRVTLRLIAPSPSLVVERVAAALGGTWRIRLRVKAGRTEPLPPSPSLEQRMALGLQDVTAARAFLLIARDLKAELETEGDLGKRVAVRAFSISASSVLDQVAEQAGATWSLVYLIDVPEAPPPPPPSPPTARSQEPSPSSPPRPAPSPPRELSLTLPSSLPSGIELRAALLEAFSHILKVGPDRRSEAVGEFVGNAGRLFKALDRLSPVERDTRIRTMIPLLTAWRRLYRGLAPDVQRQLAPAMELLERNLRL
jgi:hypothetical protein